MNGDELLHNLRDEMDRHRDNLDGGLLAPGWVLAMSTDQQVEAAEQLSADTEITKVHQPVRLAGGSTCAADGQRYPCDDIEALVGRYVTEEGPEAGRAKDLDELIGRLGRA